MPPSNVAFGSATFIGSTLPIDNVQSDINDAGVNYDVFYRFAPPTGITMVWAWATSENSSGYMPTLIPYDQSFNEILTESTVAPLNNNPIQFPITPTANHYLKVVKNANSAGPEHVNVKIRAVPNETTIPYNALIVNGDIVNQGLGVFSGATSYETIKYINTGIAIGEGGDITPLGKSLFDNRILADRKVKLYDSTFTELGTASTSAYSWIRYNRTTGYFWILVMDATAKIYKLNPAVLPLSLTLVATIVAGTGDERGISTNNAETIAYFCRNVLGAAVKRWNLSTDTAMSDLVAAPTATSQFLDSLVLEDDTIIVGWSDGDAAATVTPRRYNAAGTLLNTYGPFDSYEVDYGVARLAYSPTSPNSFWLKTRERNGSTPTGDAIFTLINVSTGVSMKTIRHLEYEGRNYIGPAASSYRGESGPWNSCPFVAYPLGSASPTGGIYAIDPGNTADEYHDETRKIPNPTVRTALFGE